MSGEEKQASAAARQKLGDVMLLPTRMMSDGGLVAGHFNFEGLTKSQPGLTK